MKLSTGLVKEVSVKFDGVSTSIESPYGSITMVAESAEVLTRLVTLFTQGHMELDEIRYEKVSVFPANKVTTV